MFRAGILGLLAIGLIAMAPIPLPKPTNNPTPPVATQTGEKEQPATNGAASAKPSLGDSSTHPLHIQAACEHGCGYAEDDKGWWKKLWTDPIAMFTAALAALTLGLIVVGGIQSLLIRNTITQSDKQHALTERANIVPGAFKYELANGVDRIAGNSAGTFSNMALRVIAEAELEVSYFAVQPIWSNTGNTPTKNMRIRVSWSDREDLVGSYNDPWRQFFVAPKSSEPSEFIEMAGLEALIQGGLAGTSTHKAPSRLIWGVAEYQDIFDKWHWMCWCYRIRASRPNPGQGLKIGFIQWREYNATGTGQSPAEVEIV